MKHLFVLALASALMGLQAQAKTVRATDLIAQGWNDLSKLEEGTTIEFRQGDELPVSLSAEGDLLETTRNEVSYVGVKKNFWVRIQKNDVLMSLDGVNYKKIQDSVTGMISADASTPENGGAANAINIKFIANLK